MVQACVCKGLQTQSWESFTEERWPSEMNLLGTLRAAEDDEPTFEEFHPRGTRYESVDAPIAVEWFPFNRCDVYACAVCSSIFLRYTEFGGYYVDHRVRMVNPQLVV